MPFKITERAAKQIKSGASQSGNGEIHLRVAARKMADGGIDYAMGLDEPQDIDTIHTQHGVSLLVAATSADYLDKATLDYVELEPGKHEFIFLNPEDPHYVPPHVE